MARARAQAGGAMGPAAGRLRNTCVPPADSNKLAKWTS